MKAPTNGPRLRSARPLVAAMSFGMVTAGMLAQANAENVDSELVLLVDITRPELSPSEFNRLMDGYASAFSSTEIMDSIQSGVYGRIAVTMMLFGNSSTQVVGIPWMTIGNSSQAEQFAALARSVTRPFSIAAPNAGTALTAATLSFGSETGGAGNGFESAVQIIEVASAGVPANSSAAATAASSANALASGVDLINALGLGNRAAAVETFYAANVIGSTIDGVAATTTTSRINGTLATTMNGLLSETVQTGATVSVSAVPEPGTLFGLIPATLLLLKRRRR